MADFGQLDRFNDSDYEFTFKGKEYEVTVPLRTALKARKKLQENRSEKMTVAEQSDMILASSAELLGGKYDPKNGTFSGGIVAELEKQGISLSALDRLLTTIYLDFQFGEETAQIFLETGDMGKAFGLSKLEKALEEAEAEATKNPAGDNDAPAETATQEAPGEMDGND